MNIIIQIVGWIASLLVLSAFYMKTMIPLRITAICSNVAFITFAIIVIINGNIATISILILHSALLPLNIFRLVQMKKLIKKVKLAKDTRSIDYLIPYMSKEKYYENEFLFKKGDLADKIYYIKEGSVILPELQKEVPKGGILGEVGIFTPTNERACSAVCAEESEVYTIKSEKVLELYYQNPKFGFFMISSIAKLVTDKEKSQGGVYIHFDDYTALNED